MRSYRFRSFGTVDSIRCRNERAPQCGQNEVLVRVRAVSLNYRDMMILNGNYPVPAKLGIIPVSDGAGDVVAVGSGVSRFAVGDRVSSVYFMRWMGGRLTPEVARHQFGASHDGWLTTYRAAHEDSLVGIADHLTLEEAACYPCAGVTAWSAVAAGRRVLPGEQVLVVGGGVVALFALQFARLSGARVIAVTSDPAKTSLMRELGADDVVVAARNDDWSVEVRRLTAGRGVDRVVETVGPPTLSRSILACGVDAEIALCGVFPAENAMFDPRIFSGRLLSIRRLAVGSREAAEEMMRAVAHHRIRPPIGRIFGFDEAQSAYNHLLDGHRSGKVVITGDTSDE